jgi:ATP-dependent Zn protease
MTKYQQQEDRAMMFDTEMRAHLAILLGGRAAEQLCFGHISTGASDDIQRATSLAYKVRAWTSVTSVALPDLLTFQPEG